MLEDCPAILLLEAAMTGHHSPQLPAIAGGKMKGGRASETPVAFRKVRRLSGWCIDFVLSGKPDTHSIKAAYLFLNNLL